MNFTQALNDVANKKRQEFVDYCITLVRDSVDARIKNGFVEFGENGVAFVRNELAIDTKFDQIYKSYTDGEIVEIRKKIADSISTDPDVARLIEFKVRPADYNESSYVTVKYYFCINIKQ